MDYFDNLYYLLHFEENLLILNLYYFQFGDIRTYIVNSLIDFARNCSKSAYEHIIKEQLTAEVDPDKINDKVEEERNNLLTKKIISFDEILDNSSIIFMNEDINSITFIPKNNINEIELRGIRMMLNNLSSNSEGIKNFKKMK